MPPTPRILKNQYVLVRHGRSEANEAGIISSDPDVGAEQHDLTDFGREQVHKTTRDLREKYTTDIPLQIYASPFLRTRSTAAILHDEGFPETPAVVVDDRLAERFFGMWDGKEDSNYENVWAEEENMGTMNSMGCESTDEVASRAWSLIEELEADGGDPPSTSGPEDVTEDTTDGMAPPQRICMLVAHGDVLQILQTRFVNVPSATHRSLEHMQTAGWREMSRVIGTKPRRELIGR